MVRSLGRWVPADWVAKEVRVKSKFDYDPEIFSVTEDHLILHFRMEKDYATILKGGPLFVAGQLLAMEAWKVDFVPRRRPI